MNEQVFSRIYGDPKNYNDDRFLEKRLSEMEKDKAIMEAERDIILKKALQSDNPNLIVKAQGYLSQFVEERARNRGGVSVVLDPDLSQYSRGGYVSKRLALTPDYLRKMAATPIIKSIITTRQTQVSRFSSPQSNKYDYGFVIKKKKKLFSGEEEEVTNADKREIERLTNFILNGGESGDAWMTDNFDTFLQKIIDDSLVLDAASFEIGFRKNSSVYSYQAVDGGTIFKSHIDKFGTYQAKTGEQPRKIKGYFPEFVQVIQEKIVADFYPWELCYGIRNARTDLGQNGYGRSELEDMVTVVTSLLNTEKYNSNFFTQGSNPKGMLIVPEGVNRGRLHGLRQEWASMIAGVSNSHKIPVIEGKDVQWQPMHVSNADMEFSKWQDYLVRVACAMYKIAPEEIGFYLGNGGNSMFEGDKEARLKYSKDKGLIPLLKSIEFWINKWVIGQINDRFEFKFAGINEDDEDKEVERDIKLSNNIEGLREVRKRRGLPADLEEGDMILNQNWISWKTQQQFADQQEESTEAAEPDEDFWNNIDIQKSIASKHTDNPMIEDANRQLIKALKDE
jgi:hypothetical protein